MLVKEKKKRPPRKRVIKESFELDPRRNAFIAAYMDPNSETYGRIMDSGLKAGFAPEHAKNIVARKPDWLSNAVEKLGVINQVRKNIKKHLELNTSTKKLNKKTNEIEIKEDPKLLKIQGDMTMFVAEKIVDEYKKIDKKDPSGGTNVNIKQIIIIAPNGNEQSTTNNTTNTKTIPSISASQ